MPTGPGTSRPLTLEHRHIIVAGFGIVGRMIAQQLEKQGVDVTLVELNVNTHDKQRSLDKKVVHGDIREPAVLKQAGIDEADALILTVPDEQVAIEASQIARELHPGLFIAARTNYFSRGLMAGQAGADVVVVEEVVTAEAMRDVVIARLCEGE